MCGRFVSATPAAQIADFFEAGPPDLELPVSFNVAPTAEVYVVGEGSGGRSMRVMHWGLVPPWSKDTTGASRLINARSETVAEKPSFRSAFRRRRCIMPVDGFYEWTTTPGALRKQPVFIHSTDGAPLALAALWEFWQPADADQADVGLFSSCIITCPANSAISKVHDRMPVILRRQDWDLWMTGASDSSELSALMAPAPADALEFHPVSTDVNSARNNGEHLIEPIDPEPLGEVPGQGTLL
jgi:putative SOS response-associated peptidase YedK